MQLMITTNFQNSYSSQTKCFKKISFNGQIDQVRLRNYISFDLLYRGERLLNSRPNRDLEKKVDSLKDLLKELQQGNISQQRLQEIQKQVNTINKKVTECGRAFVTHVLGITNKETKDIIKRTRSYNKKMLRAALRLDTYPQT